MEKTLADYYYGLLKQALKTNNWDFVYRKLENLEKETKSKRVFLEITKDIAKNNLQKLNKELASQIVKITLCISFPNPSHLRDLVKGYYLTLKELEEVKSLASMKPRGKNVSYH